MPEEASGLDELLGTDFSHIANNALYETSDILFSHKNAIEQFLRSYSKRLFGLGESIILCDFHTRCSKKIGDICDQSASADVEVKPGLNIASHILTSIPYLSMELDMFSDAYC